MSVSKAAILNIKTKNWNRLTSAFNDFQSAICEVGDKRIEQVVQEK